MGGYAWVTLATNNSYSLGALVLAHSLKKANTAHKLVVLITPAVSQPMREQLQTVFDVVKVVDVLDSKDEAHLALMKRPDLGITFTKIHCWRLVEFEKCVFLDADTLVVRNCDELFEKEEFSAAPDVSWPDCFNSGVFVYRPSVETFNKILQFAVENRSFDGGDQGLLNQFFSDWATEDIKKHLPFVYNLTSVAAYSYIPAFKHYGSETRIVHFIGSGKPWLQQLDVATRTVTPTPGSEHLAPLLQQWWDLFCEKVHPGLDKSLESNNDGMSHPPVEARSNFLPIALTDEPETGLVSEPCTPYREKDDFRQHNLPYLPFHVKGPSGELLNVEFLSASAAEPEEQQPGYENRAGENDPSQRENESKKESEDDQNYPTRVCVEQHEMKEPEKRNEDSVEGEDPQQEQQQEQQKEEPPPPPPPPKDPFDYYSFFPDETCISSYLEKNVVTYQPFSDHHPKPSSGEPEPEQESPSLPRFLTIPQNDQRQSGNTDTQPQEEDHQHQQQPASEPPRDPPTSEREATPQKESTPGKEEQQAKPPAEKRELSKSKSMSCFPCDMTTAEDPPRRSIWKSQPDLHADPNRKYSMPRLKPILPKQRSFSKSVPSAIPKVTMYTEFLISSEYKDPVDLPHDKIGFVETHIHKLRRSKSDADIRDKFGPLPYSPSPVVEKPTTPKRIPRHYFDNEYYDLTQCKRQMGNKPKPKDETKKTVHSLPALKPIAPARDKKSTLIKKRKSKELSPGDGGKEKMLKREPKKARERKRESIIIPRNASTVGSGNNLDEILKRLREFSKDYQHFFGVGAKPPGKSVTCKNATVQDGDCGVSEAFEKFSTPVSTRSAETQTPKKTPAVENSDFRQFRNYIKDQKETSQKGLLGIQDILSGDRDEETLKPSHIESGKIDTKDLYSSLENSRRGAGESNNADTMKGTESTKLENIPVAPDCDRDSPIKGSCQPPDGRQAEPLEQEEAKVGTDTTTHSKEHSIPVLRKDVSSSESQREAIPVPESEDASVVVEPSSVDKGEESTQSEEHQAGEVSENRKVTVEVPGNLVNPNNSATGIHQEDVEQLNGTTNSSNEQEESKDKSETPINPDEGIAVPAVPDAPAARKTQNGHVTPHEDSLPETKRTPQVVTEIIPVKVKRGGEKTKKREQILCVPDFDTPRTSRVLPPNAPAEEPTKARENEEKPRRLTAQEPRTTGRENGLESGRTNGLSNDSPDGAVRISGKRKAEGKLASPRTPSTPPYGNGQSESFEESKSSSGIAGAIAQLSLDAGSEQTPQSAAASSAQEEYLRRQNWETGNMDYMGRDSFENIWSKICQTIEAKELEESAAAVGSPQPPTQKERIPEQATESPVSLSAILQKCPEFIETLPGEPAAGPVEDDEIIFSKPENRQPCLTNITEEEEAGTEVPGTVKLSDILKSVPAVSDSVPASTPAPAPATPAVSTPVTTPAPVLTPVSSPVSVPASTAGTTPAATPVSASIPASPTGSTPASAPPSVPAAVPASAQASIPASPTGSTPASAPPPVPASAPASIPASPTVTTPASAPLPVPTSAPASIPASPTAAAPASAPAPVPASAPASIPASPTGSTPASAAPPVPASAPASIPASPTAVTPASAKGLVPTSAPASIPASPTGSTPVSAPLPVPASAPASIPASPTAVTPASAKALVPASAPASIPASPTGSSPASAPLPVPASPTAATPTSAPAPVPASAPASIPASPTGSTPASAPAAIPASPIVTTPASTPAPIPASPTGTTPTSSPASAPASSAAPVSTLSSVTVSAPAPAPTPASPPATSAPTVPTSTPTVAKEADKSAEETTAVKTEPGTPSGGQDKKPQEPPKPEPGAAPTEKAPQQECKTVALLPQAGDGQTKTEASPQQEKKAEECKTVAIPSPPIVFPGAPPFDSSKIPEEKPAQVQSEPIPLPPPSPAQDPTPVKTTRSESPKEEGKQKKGVFTKILEMVGVAPKEKNGGESKSVFYDVDEAGKQEPQKAEVKEAEKPPAGETPEKAEVQPADASKPEEQKQEGEQKPGQPPFPKPARSSSPKDAIQVSAARRSPSPKLTIPAKPPETEITTPTPPPQPDVPPRKNSALLKVDDTILPTPPVPEPGAKETRPEDDGIKGKVTTEIEDIIGKAKSEVESLLQERRSTEKETGESINTMKLLLGGEEPGKPEEVEELRVTSEEERRRHKGEVVTSKLSDQILKAIPPPRRKAISEASASTSAIPKPTAGGEPRGAAGGEGSKPKPTKPSSIPVPPPRNRGKPGAQPPAAPAPAPSKAKGKK